MAERKRINDMMTKIKPCPFCGSKAEIEEKSNIYNKAFRVKCTNIYQCAIKQDQWNLKEKAIDAWNMRVGEADDARRK